MRQSTGIESLHFVEILRSGSLTGIDRSFPTQDQIFGGDLGYRITLIDDPQLAVIADFSDDRGIQIPLMEDRHYLVYIRWFDDQKHPFLRLGEHDLIRRHSMFALRNLVDLHGDPDSGFASHFRAGASQPRCTHILDADHEILADHLEGCLEQELFHEGIADLNRGSLLFRFIGEIDRGEGRSVYPVTSGLGSDIDHEITDSLCC